MQYRIPYKAYDDKAATRYSRDATGTQFWISILSFFASICLFAILILYATRADINGFIKYFIYYIISTFLVLFSVVVYGYRIQFKSQYIVLNNINDETKKEIIETEKKRLEQAYKAEVKEAFSNSLRYYICFILASYGAVWIIAFIYKKLNGLTATYPMLGFASIAVSLLLFAVIQSSKDKKQKKEVKNKTEMSKMKSTTNSSEQRQKGSEKATPNYCKYCGAPLDSDSIFCANCGKSIKGEK